jgi:initiation factor 2B subunit 1/2 family protein
MTAGVSRSLGSSSAHPEGLSESLAEVAADRAASAAQVVHEASGLVRRWLAGRSDAAVAGQALETALDGLVADQGWRGPVAVWIDSIRRTLAFADREGRSSRDVLEEELGHWLFDPERGLDGELSERAARENAGRDPASARTWDGEPLTAGRRLPSRSELARKAAAVLDSGESVLVTAWSETVALALETAWRTGKSPSVVLPEAAPELDGRRMARRLSRAGIAATLVYDAAVSSIVPRVDRVWLPTEAIGAGAFLARLGTRSLIEECARRNVPASVLATSDKLVPGGLLRLPAWAASEGWRLWEDAPEGVRLEPQFHEAVPTALLELVGGFHTETGAETAAAMHLRALRVEAQPPASAETTRANAESLRSGARTT